MRPHGLYSQWNSPGQNTGVGSLSLLQGIFPTQGSNPGLSRYRWILYQLSHKGSPLSKKKKKKNQGRALMDIQVNVDSGIKNRELDLRRENRVGT